MVYRPYNPAARFSKGSVSSRWRPMEDWDPQQSSVQEDMGKVLNDPTDQQQAELDSLTLPDPPPSEEVFGPGASQELLSPLGDPGLLPSQGIQGMPTVGSQVPATSADGGNMQVIRELMDRYINRRPTLVPRPEEPKATIKGALKNTLMGMIPGYPEMQNRRRAQEEENRQMGNAAAVQQYREQNAMLKPILTKAYDAMLAQQEAAYRTRVMMAVGVPKDQATTFAFGYTPQQPRALPQSNRYEVEFQDGNKAPGYSRDDSSGAPRVFLMNGTPVPPEAIKNLYSISTNPQAARDTTFDKEQEFAQALRDSASGKPVDPALLSAAQARQQWNKDKAPPPSYEFIQGPEGYVAANRRNPGAVPVPVPGAGGQGQLTPPAKQMTAATKGKVDQAWIILQTGNDILETMKRPEVNKEIGILAGRKAETWDRTIGSMSPAARELYTKLASFYSLQGLLHGWRAIRVKEEFEKAIGTMAQIPAALAAGIKGNMSLSESFIELGKAQGYEPAPMTSDPFKGITDQELFRRANSKQGDKAAYDELVRRKNKGGR